jgi:hypothetical protein
MNRLQRAAKGIVTLAANERNHPTPRHLEHDRFRLQRTASAKKLRRSVAVSLFSNLPMACSTASRLRAFSFRNAGAQAFFEAETDMVEEMPDAVVADFDPNEHRDLERRPQHTHRTARRCQSVSGFSLTLSLSWKQLKSKP